MGTKRTVIDRTKPPGGGKITPEVVAAFRQLLEFERNPAAAIWESDGGCKREYYNLCVRLDIELLGFEPWNYWTPSAIRGHSARPEWVRPYEFADWESAIKVRRELEQAARSEPLKKAPGLT